MQDNVPLQVAAWKSHLKKGTLELVVLALIDSKASYGLELLARLNELNLEVHEGSIYPLLARLRSEEKATTQWVDEAAGHAHKYYTLTPRGRQFLKKMASAWQEYAGAIDTVVKQVQDHE